MSPAATKRRKVGDNSSILFKPFKSPMRIPNVVSTESLPTPSGPAASNKTSNTNFAERLRQIKAENKDDNQSEEFSKLRKDELALLSQISVLKAELGQVKQAHSIETSNRETELLDLVRVWRSASQQAAEECYATFRDKVHATGGLRRWNEAEKVRKDNAFSSWGLAEDAQERSDGREEDAESSEPEEEPPSNETSTTAEAATLSMDVMLQYMSIEPGIIGYDIDNQRWLP